MQRQIYIILFLLGSLQLITIRVASQNNFNIKMNCIGMQLKQSDSSNSMFSFSESETGIVLFTPGILLAYENYIRDRQWSVRVRQGFYTHKLKSVVGNSGLSLHTRIFNRWKSVLSAGLGADMAWPLIGTMYNNELYLSANIEYNYYIAPMSDLSISFDYYLPGKIGFMAGVRLWISKEIKHKAKCGTCPDFH